MPAVEPGKIRNVAVVGHRGTGKTSLVEAMLFQSGATNRLGTVEQGTTVSDWDEDEQRRQMSLAASLCHAEWQDRKINLIDAPGDPGFQADAIAALRVVEGALFVVERRDGRRGADDAALGARRRARPLPRPLREHARPRARRLLPRRSRQLRAQLSERCVAVQHPDRARARAHGHRRPPPHARVHVPGGRARGRAASRSRTRSPTQAAEYREQLLDAVVETDEALMERYLEGEELAARGGRDALKNAVTRGELFPVACGSRRRTSARPRCSTCSSRASRRRPRSGSPSRSTRRHRRVRLQDPRRPVRGPHQRLPRPLGHARRRLEARRTRARTARSGSASCSTLQGKEHAPADAFGAGDIGAVAKLKDMQTGDLLLEKSDDFELPTLDFPEPVMSFAITPKAKGDEEKVATSLRRLAEEDPTLVLRRDEQTGEQLLAGLRQMHVEVAVERLHAPLRRRRRPAPAARAVPRDDPQGVARAGQLQEADRRPRPVRRLPHRARAARRTRGLRVRGQDRRRRHPAELPARGRQGHPGGDGSTASSPARRCRACASCSSTARTTTSTPRRWRSRSPARWRSRTRTRRPTRCCSSRSWRSR